MISQTGFGRLWSAVLLVAALMAPLGANAALLARKPPAAAKPPAVATTPAIWVATWEGSPTLQQSPAVLTRQTVREIARVSVGGIYVRVRLSNEFGDRPLVIGSAHIALAARLIAAGSIAVFAPLTVVGASG